VPSIGGLDGGGADEGGGTDEGGGVDDVGEPALSAGEVSSRTQPLNAAATMTR
jgi:hypothetical protein